jgi:GNAT superfamily N-acetyltransferase
MPTLTIRPVVASEVPLLLGFIRALAKDEGFPDPVTANEPDLMEALFGPTPAASVVFACLDDVPVGFALYYFTFSTTLARRGLHLDDLYVEPGARGHGVGRALIAHLARVARRHNCGRFEWWALRWNERAIAFYRQLGATAMDDLVIFRTSGDALTVLAR